MKKRLFLFIVMMTLFTASASAAPARELSFAAQQSADLIREIQPLADAVAAAAWDSGILRLSEDEAPEGALLERLLLQALRNGLLSYADDDGAVALSPEEAAGAARRLFTAPDPAGIGLPANGSITLRDGMLRFSLSGQDDYVGAHIHDLSLFEEGLLISADIYILSGIRAAVFDAPEDSLRWLSHIEMKLKPRSDSPSGFALSSFSVSPAYQAKGFVLHEEKDLYELRYPDTFVSSGKASGAMLDLASADGTAQMTLTGVPGTLESIRNEWLGEDRTDEAAVQMREDGRLELKGHDEMRIAVSQDGVGNCLVLVMTYPKDRALEYSLYWSFIVNSFIVYSNSVG